jgi:DNA-binding XRE family transcriptional regulator
MVRVKNGCRTRREAAGLAREKLAAKADCSSATIRLVEAGAGCSDEMAERIANVLCCTPAQLFEVES